LWLQCNSMRLVALDIETGKLLHNIKLVDELTTPEFLPLQDNLLNGDMHLDEALGVIKSLSGRVYWEFDLRNLKTTIKKDFGKDAHNSWRITKSRFYTGNKNLYFLGANRGEWYDCSIGIFDTKTCEIIWSDGPKEEEKYTAIYIDPPQCNDKYLGVLDSSCNLFIYELVD
jgi:hypothetical protein